MPPGVTVKVDKNGNPVLDAKGNPIFIDKLGQQVIVSKTVANDMKMHTQVVSKEVKSNFIFKDGKKVEVF